MFVVLASGSLVCVHCVGFPLFPCRARRYPARMAPSISSIGSTTYLLQTRRNRFISHYLIHS